MIKVELQGISKSYFAGTPVLLPLDLQIEPGELFFLLGPSGCGKSTLLRLLAGFLEPDSGTIRFDDRDVTKLPPERREAGMVFQNYALWPHMSVFDNVAFGLDVRKIRGEERRRQVTAALQMVRLEELADRMPGSLSGGQQQRAALARALAFRPELLLLDEPLSNLDAQLRDSMRWEIRRICKSSGLTAVYVTHDRQEALSMADRIAVLHDGRLAQVGTAEQLYRHPVSRFVAEFMGAANFLPGTVAGVDEAAVMVTTALGVLKVAGDDGHDWTPGRKVLVMIRPECLRFASTEDTVNVFEARLNAGVFMGENTLWSVVVDETGLEVCESCAPSRSEDCVYRLTVPPEYAALLPEEG